MVGHATPKMSAKWIVALILVATMGLLALVCVMTARRPDLRGERHAAKSPSIPGPTVTYGELRSAKPDRLALRVLSVLPDRGVISAYEPIIVNVMLTNVSSSRVGVYSSGDFDVRIEVRDSDGRPVGDSPVHSYGEVMSSSHALSPGQSMRSWFIPSAVYQFKNPGRYSVRIMLLDPPGKITNTPSDLGPAWAEATIPVDVRPFDGARLRARCDELIEPRKLRPSSLYDFPPHEHMMALWSVRHNAALPALRFVADNWGEFSYAWPTAVAIRRIGTPESAVLFKALSSRRDRMGRTARSAAKEGIRIHSSDYFAGWTSVRSPEATVNEFLYAFRTREWEQARSCFSDFFLRKHADELKSQRLFTDRVGQGVQSILNDPRSKALRSRKQGKFTIVDVGQEGARGAAGQIGVVQFQTTRGGGWRLTDFPSPAPQ